MTSKWMDRGFWVSKHFYWQSMLHYLWHSAKHRSFTFFSAANPAIPFGGMLDESKAAIDQIIPSQYRPMTIVYDPARSIENQLKSVGLSFPIVVKPDIGLKGHQVYKLSSLEEARQHILNLDTTRHWLLQEYIDYQREYALLFAKCPETNRCEVLSLIEKKYPVIVGDGQTTLKELILAHKHPFLRKKKVLQRWRQQWNRTLAVGEVLTIDDVGNYSRGASFHSQMDALDATFTDLCAEALRGFDQLYFYRMDLKADKVEDIAKGNFKVIEVNGAKSEPLHIYDPQHGFWENVKHIKRHWQILSSISGINLSKGYALPTFSEGMTAVRSVKRMLAN